MGYCRERGFRGLELAFDGLECGVRGLESILGWLERVASGPCPIGILD